MLLLLAVSWSGCSSTHGHTALGLDVAWPEDAEPVRVNHALPDRYGVLALSLGVREGIAWTPGRQTYDVCYPFPAEILEDHLKGLLEEAGGFSKVIQVTGEDGGDVARSARELGADLLAEVTLDRHYLALLERSPGVLWGVLLWFWGGGTAYWFHDHVFEVAFRATVRVTDLTSGKLAGEEVLRDVSRREALSYHEWGWGAGRYFLSLIWPPTLGTPDPEKVMSSLLAASGPELWRPLAELLGSLHVADAIRIGKPEGGKLPVRFTFQSPRDGTLVGGGVGLHLELDLSGTLQDLVAVRVNDEVLWDADGRWGGERLLNVPPRASYSVRKGWLPFEEDRIVIEVLLRSIPEPIFAELRKVPEVRLGSPLGGNW